MFTIKTPDRYLKEWYQKKETAVKTAFFAAVIFGLMTHLYQFTNKLYNYDELANTPGGNGASVEQGRWFLKWMGDLLLKHFGGVYSLPLLNGVLSLLLLAISAAMIVEMFEVKSPILSAVIGGVFVAFPSIVCLFFYMFTAVFYAVSILFAVWTAYLVIRYPKNIVAHVAAVLLLACSLGVYQAYFPITVCLLVASVILSAAFSEEEKNWKDVVFQAARYVAVLAAGMVVYFLINKAVLSYYDMEMISYQGGASMGKITLDQLLSAVKRCYVDFFNLGRDNVLVLNATGLMRKCYQGILILAALSVVLFLILSKRNWFQKIWMLLGIAIFPVSMFLVYVMAPDAQTYTLMGYAVSCLLIFFAVWADAYCRKGCVKTWIGTAYTWLSELVLVMLLISYIWYGNGCYMSLEYTKNHDMAYFQTMITQIKSIDGYDDTLPVAFVGNVIDDATNNQGSLMGPVFAINGKSESNVNVFSRTHIITQYLGFAPTVCGYEETRACMESEVVQKMPSYPDDGSIQIVDGIIVVKFSDYEL